MLRSSKDLPGLRIHATDGDIGHVDQCYFDDEQWLIRYLVVDVGSWLSGRSVLIAPVALTGVHWDTRRLEANLTREQVRQGPLAELHQPLTRRWQHAYHAYYEWPIYWIGTALGGASVYPSVLDRVDTTSDAAAAIEEDTRTEQVAAETAEDAHLQSSKDVNGYQVEASDGAIGHITDFILDFATWALPYLVVDTGDWWPGQKVLVSVAAIQRVSWSQGKVAVNLTRDQIRASPAYDGDAIIAPEYAAALSEYYSGKR